MTYRKNCVALCVVAIATLPLFAAEPACPRFSPSILTRISNPSPARSEDGINFAAARKRWPFAPVADPSIPKVNDSNWPANDIDRFILSKLETRGIKPASPAELRTLIRRVTYDLLGLPPTPEEIEAFLREASTKPQEAYPKLIDRLLASPRYGERWGRHWLDVVRYADTAGDNSDYPIPQHYRYRDWVIDAFNHDMPFDQFVREQIAGDLMPSKDEADRRGKLIATGYLANTKRFGSYEDERYPWYLTYEDTIDNLGRAFLGLTINCSRCHDHKFDPISQEDYYALYGFFQSTRYPRPGIELDKVQRDFVPLATGEQVEKVLKERQSKTAAINERIKSLETDKAAADKALKDAEKAKEDERKQRIEEASQRVQKLTQAIKAALKERENLDKSPLPFETIYAVAEGKPVGKRKIGNAHVQIKGDPERLGPEVLRRFPNVLGGQSIASDTKGSGRLDLARWLTDPKNPLTARVMVNRIWQHHFGRGIVPTPSDFGKQGQPPTHPELLDYLAARFVEDGWSIKAMHRRILLSRTFQMASADRPDDGLYSTLRRQRLDAESVRDTLLSISGSLDLTRPGPHPFPEMKAWDFTQHKPFKAVYASNHRTVYLMTQRIQRHPFLALFDGPDTNASTATRITSTTPLQALFLMNDPFVHEQARKFASRLLSGKKDDGGCIEEAYILAFGRPVTNEEKVEAQAYLTKVREKLKSEGVKEHQLPQRCWESFTRVLYMCNEFVYVE
jgi:Protein of unknown function (DUF1553)/Protein of unknown function (DUF1549)